MSRDNTDDFDLEEFRVASEREADWVKESDASPSSVQARDRFADYEASRAGASRRRGAKSPSAPRREDGGKTNIPILVLIVLLACGVIFAGWKLASIFLNYHRDRSAYNDIASRAVFTVQGLETDKPDVIAPTGQTQERFVSEVPLVIDWEVLRAENEDIVGWIYCPDTVVNYPVVQTTDNEFYLTHGFDKASNTSGAIFTDTNAVLGVTQCNYIVYGHNMKDGSMFGTFRKYVDTSYYDEHPTLYLLTPQQNYRIDLICAHMVKATIDNYPGYFSTLADYQTYLNEITSSAFWVNAEAVTTDYQLITMSTCSTTAAAGFEDARLQLQGMLVPIR